MKRNEARKINHQEVVDEDKRYKVIFLFSMIEVVCYNPTHNVEVFSHMKLLKTFTSIIRAKEPKNMEARKRRAEYILKEEEMKAECIAAGRDWNIEKLR